MQGRSLTQSGDYAKWWPVISICSLLVFKGQEEIVEGSQLVGTPGHLRSSCHSHKLYDLRPSWLIILDAWRASHALLLVT